MLEYDEKRSFPRIPVNCEATIRAEDGTEKTAILRNLSGGGALLSLDHVIAAGSLLSLMVKPHGETTPPLTAQISVIKCTEAEDGKFEAPCKIEKIVA